MSIRRRSSYSLAQVEGLVASYAELREKRDTTNRGRALDVLVQLLDLERAYGQLTLAHRRVVLLHGYLGLSQLAVAELLEKSQQWVSKQYRYALEEIHWQINGGVA